MGSVEPSPEQMASFVKSGEGASPIVMINLLRYRAKAAYPEGFDATPCSGREAYQRYGEVAFERIASVNGRLLWFGSVQAVVIAPDAEQWDDAILIEYPSRKAFIEMVTQPEYLAAAPHRSAALEDSRLIATNTLAGPLSG